MGEFNRNKNQALLLEAWPAVLERAAPAYLLLAGEGGGEDLLRKKTAQLGIGEYIRFLGFRTDIPRLLQLADIALLGSFREGLPRAILEAMAAGKPVVAARIRGLRDLVEEGVSGYLVAPGDSAAMAERIARLFSDGAAVKRMGREAARRSEAFSYERVAPQMAAIYRDLLEG